MKRNVFGKPRLQRRSARLRPSSRNSGYPSVSFSSGFFGNEEGIVFRRFDAPVLSRFSFFRGAQSFPNPFGADPRTVFVHAERFGYEREGEGIPLIFSVFFREDFASSGAQSFPEDSPPRRTVGFRRASFPLNFRIPSCSPRTRASPYAFIGGFSHMKVPDLFDFHMRNAVPLLDSAPRAVPVLSVHCLSLADALRIISVPFIPFLHNTTEARRTLHAGICVVTPVPSSSGFSSAVHNAGEP